MKINEIVKVAQVVEADDVNEYLSKGYHIIKIFSTKTTNEGAETIKPTYILGLSRE